MGPWQFCHGLQPNYAQADSIAEIYYGAPLNNLKSLSDSLTQHFDSEELKYRAIFTWVCKNIQSDYALLQEQKRNQKRFKSDSSAWKEWQKQFSQRLFRKLLRERKTICSGYAYLIHHLSYHAGLASQIINGYGRTAKSNIGNNPTINHAWNAIRINGKWFLSDATWASGQISSNDLLFKPNYDDVYFLVSPDIFVQDHYPLDARWMLTKGSTSLDKFLQAPLIYKGAYLYRAEILKFFRTTKGDSEELTVQFRTRVSLENGISVRDNNSSLSNAEIIESDTIIVRIEAKRNHVYHVFHGSTVLFSIIPDLLPY